MNNLPPGVTEGMIPGNRPEDVDIDCPIYLCVGDGESIVDFMDRYGDSFYKKLPRDLWGILSTIESIYHQLLDDESGSKFIHGYREMLKREMEMVDSIYKDIEEPSDEWSCPFGKPECDRCDDMCEDRR